MDRRAALFINTAALIRLARGVLSLLRGTEEAGQARPRVKTFHSEKESVKLINIVLVKFGN